MPFSPFLLACFASIFFLAPSPAYGYIDPGSGGLLLQLILGAMVGSLFYVKRIWRVMSRLVGKKPQEASKAAPVSEAPSKQAKG